MEDLVVSYTLKNKALFYQLKQNYQPSQNAIDSFNNISFCSLASIFAGGKNSIIKELISSGGYAQSVNHTTRPPKVRDGKIEQDGIHYHFINEAMMLDKIKRGEMLEFSIIHESQVSGLDINELEFKSKNSQIILRENTVDGAELLHSYNPKSKHIFIVPPSYEEWRKRLNDREVMSEEELIQREKSSIKELEYVMSVDYFYFVINDDLKTAALRADNFIKTSKIDLIEQIKVKDIITKILQQIKHDLSQKI